MAGGRRRILVIEDDPETAEQLVDFLSASGYQVDRAGDGNDGLSRASSADHAVMTIDRMLPDIDGLAVIRRLREQGIVTPALIISALGETDDRVRGLRAGGDDYLVKPFAFAELLARVEALARRSGTVVKETVLRVGDLELDLVSRTVARRGRKIELLPREFQVLEYLVRNQGQVVPRAMLLQHVWDFHFDPTTNIIDVYVGRVRRKVDGQQAYPLIPAGSGFVSVLLAKTLRSSTFKLALICIGIFGTVFLVLFGYVYWSAATYVRGRSDGAIAAEQAILRTAYDRAGKEGLVAGINDRIANEHFQGAVYLLADSSFTRVAGNLNAWPSTLKEPAGWHDFSAPEWKPSAADRPKLRATLNTLPGGYHLLVGKEIDDLDELTNTIQTALLAGVALLFFIAVVAGIAVTRRTVGRIEAINATSRAIMQSGLGERIPLRGTRDEWDQLAGNLNSMLDRVEALMAEVKQVSDNVAHDLRTPLTRMRGRLEKAFSRQRNSEHDQSLIGDTMADLDAVLRMFASLTRISQIEAGDRTSAFRTVDLAEIASEVVELFDAAAEDKRSHLDAAGDRPVLVIGDRDLLFDAVANLVDNAIKYGREAGRVTVEVTRNDRGAVVSVADDGAGIPEQERQKVFKRFYRLERSRHTLGNGLGLSLVAAVARLHGAHIEMLDNKPGLRCRLQFPLPTRW